MQESKTNILVESVMVSKWAQRLMYTIQTEDVVLRSRWMESTIWDDDYAEVLRDLERAKLALSNATHIVDSMVRKSHPASEG